MPEHVTDWLPFRLKQLFISVFNLKLIVILTLLWVEVLRLGPYFKENVISDMCCCCTVCGTTSMLTGGGV